MAPRDVAQCCTLWWAAGWLTLACTPPSQTQRPITTGVSVPNAADTSIAAPSSRCAKRAAHYVLGPPAVIADAAGLSDLARDASGRFWAVPERSPAGASELTREILELDLRDTTHPSVAHRFRYELPRVLDTESIAVLGPELFAIGTEVQPDHVAEGSATADSVFVVGIVGGVASLQPDRGWEVSYVPWKRTRDTNHGIEAMCATPRHALMVSELRDRTSPAFAPMELRDRAKAGTHADDELWLVHDGRISALTCCEAADGALEAMAIQRDRHKDGTSVHRLLGFRIVAGGPAVVRPDFDVDLEPVYAASGGVGIMPNLEGLAPLDDSSIAMITDDSEEASGTNARLFVLSAAP